jgi:hypothetical protein
MKLVWKFAFVGAGAFSLFGLASTLLASVSPFYIVSDGIFGLLLGFSIHTEWKRIGWIKE